MLGFRFFSICVFRPGFGSKPSFLGRYPLNFDIRRPACLLAPVTFQGQLNRAGTVAPSVLMRWLAAFCLSGCFSRARHVGVQPSAGSSEWPLRLE